MKKLSILIFFFVFLLYGQNDIFAQKRITKKQVKDFRKRDRDLEKRFDTLFERRVARRDGFERTFFILDSLKQLYGRTSEFTNLEVEKYLELGKQTLQKIRELKDEETADALVAEECRKENEVIRKFFRDKAKQEEEREKRKELRRQKRGAFLFAFIFSIANMRAKRI